jgi:uridine phosphorylase
MAGGTKVYRPAFGSSPVESAGAPFEIVNEGADTGEDTGADAGSAAAVVEATGEGGVVVSAAPSEGSTVETEAASPSAPAVAPTETKEALKKALAAAQADAKKWKRRFIVATVVGSVATVGAATTAFFVGRGKKAMRGMEGMADEGLGDDLEDMFEPPAKKKRR